MKITMLCGTCRVPVEIEKPPVGEGFIVLCLSCAERAKKKLHIMLHCPHCDQAYEAEIGNNPLVKDGLTITPLPLPADIEIAGEQ